MKQLLIKYRDRGCNQNKVTITTEQVQLDISETQLAWLAGFFEAEGTFTIKTTEVNPAVSVYNNSRELLGVVAQFIGGTVDAVVRDTRSQKFNDSFQIQYQSHREVVRVCTALLPYLTLKKRQAELLIKACVLSRDEREELLIENKALNAKAQQFELFETRTAQRDLTIPTPEQWAYLAGWIEGDGTFVFQPQVGGYLYPWIVLTGTKPEAFKALFEVFGGTIKARKSKNKAWAPKVELLWGNQKYTGALLAKLIPFLKTRHAEAQILLDSLDARGGDRAFYKQRLLALREAHKIPIKIALKREGTSNA